MYQNVNGKEIENTGYLKLFENREYFQRFFYQEYTFFNQYNITTVNNICP